MSTRITEELSKQTRELVNRFEQRADGFRGRTDLASLIVHLDPDAAEKSARDLFGKGEFLATGIDGSMDFDERLQMMLFYSNATAYSCPFTVGEHLRFDLDAARRDHKLAASAAIPLWAEDLGAVSSREPELDIDLEHSMERVPNSFMTLAELYLAFNACGGSKILFLDRPLSGTFSTLSRDVRNLLKRGESGLTDWSGSNRLSLLDIELALNLGAPDMAVPTRRRFLPFAMIKLLVRGPMSFDEMARGLGVGEAEVARAARVVRRIDSRNSSALLADSTAAALKLNDGVAGYWERAAALSLDYATKVFAGERHPLVVGADKYLTVLDVNTVAFVLLCMVCQKARDVGTLLIGIAKDTTATDITRAVLPYARSAGFVKLASQPPRLKNDKAFLAILSSENPSIKTPWRTVGYDSAYSTMVELDGRLVGARKVVSRERLFARSFFQLRTLKSDPAVRSQVFLFDRMYDERHDSEAVRSFEVEERAGRTGIDAYFEGPGGSPLSNLVLHILSLNDNPEVYEAYGHNQLLYLADKAVKAEVRMLRSSLRGVADLRVGGVSRRRKIFGLVTTYREQRAEAEHARMGG
jgi:hypothetical protein